MLHCQIRRGTIFVVQDVEKYNEFINMARKSVGKRHPQAARAAALKRIIALAAADSGGESQLNETRRRECFLIAAKPADDLDSERQAAVVCNSRHVHARRADQSP